MRARNLKPGFFKNEDLADCQFAARILFQGLWCIADREGRLEYRPKRIKAEIFPYDDINIFELIQELINKKFIIVYSHDGWEYLQVVNFLKHQYPHCKEPESNIPAPCENSISTVQNSFEHPLNIESLLPITESRYIVHSENDTILEQPEKINHLSPPTGGNGRAKIQYDKAFDTFFSAYPLRQNKAAAYKAWKKQKNRLPPIDDLIKIVDTQKTWRQWKEGFIPHASTWINNARWEDQAPEPENGVEAWLKQISEDSH